MAATIRLDVGERRAVGTAAGDRMFGNVGDERFFGRGGADRIFTEFGDDAAFGGPGNDRIFGDLGGDLLDGGPGRDRLLGQDDGDRLFGRAGNDLIDGGEGDDRLEGGPGVDRFVAGTGRDRILARDVRAETVLCGEGDDTVVADAIDRVGEDCELVSPPEAKPEGTTRERPFSFGLPHETGDGWQLQVVGTIPDATAAVLAENIFNSPPPEGGVFSIARVRVTRTAAGSGRFDGDFRLRAVGPAGVVYTTFEPGCGVIPDELPDPDAFPGATFEGNVCWAVPAAESTSLVMVDSPFLSETTRFYALR